MTSKTISNGILRAIGILTGILIILYFFYIIRSVLAYLARAAVIALVGRPIVLFLRERLKLPNILAVVLAMVLMIGLIASIFALFVPLISEQSKNLSLLNMEELQKSINTLYREITAYVGISSNVVGNVIEESRLEQNILEGLNLNFIPNFLNSFLDVLSSLSIGLFSVLFISFFFLKDSKLFQNGLLIFVPNTKEKGTVNSINKINSLLSRYFVGLLLQIFILFVIYTIVLLVIGIENAIVIAFLCALFNIIPYIGPLIGGGLMIILTMTSNLGADFSEVILPNSVKSHPLEIFLVIIIAGLLFGVVGMIVAVPGYTAIKVILKEFLAENKIVKKLTKNL